MKTKLNIAIGIGVHKGGTSWLYRIIGYHPMVKLLQRDTHFFSKDEEYQKGIDNFLSVINLAKSKQMLVEMSNDYLYSKKAIERINDNFEDAKIFVCLRNPCERAYSHYLQDLKTGLIKSEVSFAQALAQSDHYILIGKYKAQIVHLLNHFKNDQIHFILFDDIKDKPDSVAASLFDFLGLEKLNLKQSILESKINPARIPKNIKLEQFQNKMYYNLRYNTILKPLWWLSKKIKLGDLIRRFNGKKSIHQKDEANKLRHHFAEDIDYVKELLNRPNLEW